MEVETIQPMSEECFERRLGATLLRTLAWRGGHERLSDVALHRLSREVGCTGERVWLVRERLATTRVDNPAAYITDAITRAWNVRADMARRYRRWRRENIKPELLRAAGIIGGKNERNEAHELATA